MYTPVQFPDFDVVWIPNVSLHQEHKPTDIQNGESQLNNFFFCYSFNLDIFAEMLFRL